MAVKITKSQKQVEKLKEEPKEENKSSQIGFAILEEEDEESDDEIL